MLLAMLFLAQAHAGVPYNTWVLNAVQSMPQGGGYSVKPEAGQAMLDAITLNPFQIDASAATPSFCTTATYLVFLKVVDRYQAEVQPLESRTLSLLAPPTDLTSLFQDDGKGAWGRWNANGPGTGRFAYETGIGENFTEEARALPGDFLKIWWTDEVGGRERGHSVVYLGSRPGEIQYFSSNQGTGYSRVWVSTSKVKHALYTRLTDLSQLARVSAIPETDAYLRDCKTLDSSFEEAKKMSGL